MSGAPKIIGIVGKIGSGKTALADFLKEMYEYSEIAFSDPIKEIAMVFGFEERQVFGSQEDKLELHEFWGISGREFLQKFGTDIGRDVLGKIMPTLQDPWVNIVRQRLQKADGLIVVSDVRFLDEAKIIHQEGGILIRLVRDVDLEKGSVLLDKDMKAHASEKEQEEIIADYTILNNFDTLEGLYNEMGNILKTEKSKVNEVKKL